MLQGKGCLVLPTELITKGNLATVKRFQVLALFQNEYGFALTKGQCLKHQHLNLFTVAKLPLVMNSVDKPNIQFYSYFVWLVKIQKFYLTIMLRCHLGITSTPNHPYGETADIL